MATTNMSKTSKILISVLSIFLAIVIGAGVAVQTLAEASDIRYLADLKLYYAEDSGDIAAAKTRCEKDGYIFLNHDLNSGTTKSYVFLGYKTTKNKEEAVTDIRLLGMDTDYQLYNYNQIVEHLEKQQSGTAYNMDMAALEFIEAYDSGSPRAQDAYEALNLFRVDNNTLLGDYILDGKANQKFFMKLLTKASNGTTNAVISYLNAGVAPYENDVDEQTEEEITTIWAANVANSPLWEKFDNNKMSTDEWQRLHKQYEDDAKLVFRQIQSFTSSYYTAADRQGCEAADINDPIAMGKGEEAVENLDKVQEEDTDVVYISAFEKLNQFIYHGKQKLGDWILETGLKTVKEIDLTTLYPMLEAMGEGQICMVESSGLISACANLGQNEHSKQGSEVLEQTKEAVRSFDAKASISIWEKGDVDIEQRYIAFTSDFVRRQQAGNVLDNTGNRTLEFKERFDYAMKWVSALTGVMTMAGFIAGKITYAKAAAAAVTAVTGYMSTVLTVVSTFSAFVFWAGILALLVNIITSIVVWFIRWFEENTVDPDDQSIMPAYVFDAPEYDDKVLTVKYKCVRTDDDENGSDIGDVNAREQTKWDILCYTKDYRVGSPIREDDEGKIFKIAYGDGSKQNGYDAVKYFGQRMPGDFNKFCKKNTVNGIYLSYRTENSMRSLPPDSGESSPDDESSSKSGSYLASVYLATAGSADAAHAKINQLKQKHYILDHNLSPMSHSEKGGIRQAGEQKIFTYLGYTITETDSKAVTDIRVAPYAGKTDSIYYGDIKYYYAGNSGYKVDDSKGESMPECDALYYTTDPRAGTPIPVDNLKVTSATNKAGDGWEPVSLFGSNIPYNFNAEYQRYDDTTFVTGYYLKNTYKHGGKGLWADGYWGSREKAYLFFKPEKTFTSGPLYVSGVFFVGGASYVTSNWYSKSLGSTFEKLPQYLEKTANTYINRDINLAQSIKDHLDADGRNYRVFIGYNYTHNPYRAIYDIGVFQGTTYTDSLPYTLSKTKGNGSQHFVATNYIGMQKKDYDHQSIWRYISPGNTYMNRSGNLIWDGDRYARHSNNAMNYFDCSGYAAAKTEGIHYNYEQMCFLPTNLYISGYTKGKEPLQPNDIVISTKAYTPESSGGEVSTFLEGEKALDGSPAQGAFHSVYELKNPNSLKPFNLSYPSWTDDSDGKLDSGSSMYLYLRGAKKAQGKYISSLTVGSFSRAQYSRQPGVKTSGDNLRAVDSLVDVNALSSALSGCSDEVVVTNVSIPQSQAWYSRKQDDEDHPSRAEWKAPENQPASYIGVTRTDDPSKGITGAILYITNDNVAPASITIGDGVKYDCASMTSPIEMNGKNYFLYYTKNTGVNAGLPIEEVTVDGMPLLRGAASGLTCDGRGDTRKLKLFGDVTQNNYIHLKYNHSNTNLFYNKFFIGKGDNKKAALCNLMEQECVEFLDINLNEQANGPHIYLGMRLASLDTEKIDACSTVSAKRAERTEQWDEAIADIIVTNDLPYQKDGFVADNEIFYYPVSDVNLNEGTTGNKLYMYVASNFYSGRYNYMNEANTRLPLKVYTTPYTAICMARYDRVPPDEEVIATCGKDNYVKWEYILMENTFVAASESVIPADLNFGCIKFNENYYTYDNRITMFAQRYDGSVKPGAEITGGFYTKTEDIGELYLKNQD